MVIAVSNHVPFFGEVNLMDLKKYVIFFNQFFLGQILSFEKDFIKYSHIL
jgi:hypothetical protein